MDHSAQWRQRARTELERYFKRRSLPRLALGLILILTGGIGFLISFLLLRAGMEAMWLRYPVAVLAAYGFFLGLLRGWVELEHRRFDPSGEELEAIVARSAISSSGELPRQAYGRESGKGWVDGVDLSLDFDEGCLPIVLFGVVIALIGVITLALINAPALISEVFVDAFLVSALYRRLRVAATEHWLESALKRTGLLALATAALLSVGGACLGAMAPGTHSIGPALQAIFHRESSEPE